MMKPSPKRSMPPLTITLGPNLSMSQPCRGPSRPLSARDRANAPDSTERLQPNCVCSKWEVRGEAVDHQRSHQHLKREAPAYDPPAVEYARLLAPPYLYAGRDGVHPRPVSTISCSFYHNRERRFGPLSRRPVDSLDSDTGQAYNTERCRATHKRPGEWRSPRMEIAPGVHRLENVNGSNAVLLADEQMAVVDTGISGNGEAIVEGDQEAGPEPLGPPLDHRHALPLRPLRQRRRAARAHRSEYRRTQRGDSRGPGRLAAAPKGRRRRTAAIVVSVGAAADRRRRRRAAQAGGADHLPRHARTRDAGARRRCALHGRPQDTPRAGAHTRQHLPDSDLTQRALPGRLRHQQHRPAQPAAHVGPVEAQGARRITPHAAGA